MSSRDILATLGARLDERAPELARLDAYHDGRQPLAFLAPEAKAALAGRLTRLAVNLPRLVVTSLAERLDVIGFTRDGTPDPALWAAWERNGMVEGAAVAHREALTLARAFCIVWTRDGMPSVTVESAHQVACLRDPATRAVTAALKRWAADDGRGQHAVVYEPDRITRYTTDAAGAPATSGAWRTVETLDNPLGVVPVVPIVNSDRLLGTDGVSEMADVLDLTDAYAKTLADMLVSSEFYARPRRWATGIEVPVDDAGNPVNPFASEADRTWISEAVESKFGQFAATDLAGYEAAVKVLTQAVMAVSGLPAHYVGVMHSNPSSADAIRSAEASLTARALARQRTFGQAWSQVAALVHAVRTGDDPSKVTVETVWRNPESRTPAQTADAASKLVASGILPISEALASMGYTPEQIARLADARRDEAYDVDSFLRQIENKQPMTTTDGRITP